MNDATNQARVRILCVDDEPRVLESLSLYLRRRFEVLTASSGAAGLDLLDANPDLTLILSDMRMPGMDGVAFLHACRERRPDVTRILLTGQADTGSAIAAVNEGQVFRFLTKPCPPAVLATAIEDAIKQHQLITAEHVLLRQTLLGSIKTLTDVLSLANPLAFGRATRIKALVSELAQSLNMADHWQVEVAAMLSQLGAIVLPAETVEKLYYGQKLNDAEAEAAARTPALLRQWIGNIPRLEVVNAMLSRAFDPRPSEYIPTSVTQAIQIEDGAALLRLASDFDLLEAEGSGPAHAIAAMQRPPGRHRPAHLEALTRIRGSHAADAEVREVSLYALQTGMRFAEDLKLPTGALLVPRGFEVTTGLLERLRTLRPGMTRGSIRMLIPTRLATTVPEA